MGDILNINSVVICTNILDVDTVLQGNILNVNSVTVNCDEGDSWDCSATTLTNSCSGKTQANCLGCGGTPTTEKQMSDYFSDWGVNQGLLTTDYYYADYTASTTSTSCTEKGAATRYLLGWALDNNGDALYTAAGGGIHTGWSTFVAALNATGIISVPTSTNSTNLTSVLSGLGPPASSYTPVFKDCKCTYDCNCIPISGSSGAYSSMTQCLGDDSTCCGECEVKTAIELAMHDTSCEEACIGVCGWYYTDVATPIPCPLSVGDHLYIDTECTPAARGFYSPNNCDSACEYCYEVGIAGEIIAVTSCDDEAKCNIVVLFANSDGLGCPTGIGIDCDNIDCDVCSLHNPIFPYTDAPGTPPNLQVGYHIYEDSNCECTPVWAGIIPGMYRWFYTVTGDYWCIEVGEDCEIVKKTWCDTIIPDGSDDEDSGDDTDRSWKTDEETGHEYYDEDGYRYYDVDGDGEVDYSEPIKEDDKEEPLE